MAAVIRGIVVVVLDVKSDSIVIKEFAKVAKKKLLILIYLFGWEGSRQARDTLFTSHHYSQKPNFVANLLDKDELK